MRCSQPESPGKKTCGIERRESLLLRPLRSSRGLLLLNTSLPGVIQRQESK
jgi:hypothetical protein